MTLILKKTASIYGIGGGNDWTVLDGDHIIGRSMICMEAHTRLLFISKQPHKLYVNTFLTWRNSETYRKAGS